MCFSFFITEKTATISTNVDEIMISIKREYKKYEISGENAKISGNKIIPGRCEKKVNISKSYTEMKKIGFYNPKLYSFYYNNPKINLTNNYDKLIVSGNLSEKNIYLFAELSENNKDIVKQNNFFNYNFIVNSEFYKNNDSLIRDLKEKNNSILIEMTNYKNYKYIETDYLKKYKKNIFSINGENNNFLNICSSNKSNTIAISNIIEKSYLLNIKKNISNGKFIKILINESFVNDKKIVEKYINSKGLKISSVDEYLTECN